MGRSLLLKRAGLFGNLGEIPDEGGRGPECVTPGLPSHDCILLVNFLIDGGLYCDTALPLNPGIGGIDSVIAVAGVHKVKPCSEGTSSLMRNAS